MILTSRIMKCHSRAKLSRYQHTIHLGLTCLHLSIRDLLQKSLEEEENKTERAKSGGGGLLRQSKDQKYLQTGTVVHLLGQCSPVMVYPKYVCSIFLRARRIQRGFWPVWSEQAILSGTAFPPIIPALWSQ